MKLLFKQKTLKYFLPSLFFISVFVFIHFSSNVSSQNEAAINAEIKLLNEQIKEQNENLKALNERSKKYQELIKSTQQEAASLNNQIIIIESRINQAEIEIETKELEIAMVNLEIQKAQADINSLDRKIENQKNNISKLLQIAYKQNQVSTLEVLLLNDSLADFLNQLKYLDNTNREINANVELLKDDKEDIELKKKGLEDKRSELAVLKSELESRKNALEFDRQSMVFVLEETRESEREYQSLLSQAKREQQQASAEIANLEVSVRQMLASLQTDPLESSDSTINWPVPKNHITAYFHDPRYPFRHIIGEHSGIDVRAAQGTTLRAAADGYVARVKFDGTSAYAYIMIIHNNGLSTVYGHVSSISVNPDDFVVAGQVIGRTGGAPGTPGAGAFSTGPHLHFEVRLNGLPVNPLNYLP